MLFKEEQRLFILLKERRIKGLIDFYMENAKIMKNKLQTAGYKVYGGDNAPIFGSKFLIK